MLKALYSTELNWDFLLQFYSAPVSPTYMQSIRNKFTFHQQAIWHQQVVMRILIKLHQKNAYLSLFDVDHDETDLLTHYKLCPLCTWEGNYKLICRSTGGGQK